MRYIGSKSLLLSEIHELINNKIEGPEKIFLDLFSGANVVANYFKEYYTVITNDFLYFNYAHAKAVIENNKPLTFSILGFDPFEYLNNIDNLDKYEGDFYYSKAYTQIAGSEVGYFTLENGKRIDFIRDTIEEWFKEDKLTEYEKYYLIACLMESISLVSNTTGTYGAYLKKWDKRALKPLTLLPLPIYNNESENKAYNEDSNELIRNISADIVYIDPPYNNRQYASNYHVLENIATNYKPKLNGVTRIFDWSDKKSDYSMKQKALPAMKDLINNIDAKHIIVSYNDEGILNVDELTALLKEASINDTVDIVEIPYRKYKSKISSKKNNLNEYLFYIRKKPLEIKQTSVQSRNNSENTQMSLWKPKDKSYIKSPFNYIGGKYRILKQIIPLFPKNINVFLDLFSGGANVGINVEANHYIFNDMNDRINDMFRFFSKHDSDELIQKIYQRINEFKLSKSNQEGYLAFRKHYNDNPNPLDLYVLISFSYNYQIRFNNSMEYNNPFGKNRSHFSENMEYNLRRFNNRLREIDFNFTDYYFEDFDYSCLGRDDFVYLDPPYLITTGSYNDGNRGYKNWGEKEELHMYQIMNNLTENNVRFALSNVLDHKGRTNYLLYDYIEKNNLAVHDVNFHYNNASYNSKKTGSREVLITNYSPETKEILSKNKKEGLEVN